MPDGMSTATRIWEALERDKGPMNWLNTPVSGGTTNPESAAILAISPRQTNQVWAWGTRAAT